MKRKLILTALLLSFALPRAASAVDAVSILTGGASLTNGAPASADAASPDVKPAPLGGELPPAYEPTPDADACTARADELGRLLEDWGALKTSEAADRFGVTEEDVTRRIETLTGLRNAYPAVINALSRKRQIDDALAKQRSDSAAPELSLTEKPPYPLKYYDAYISGLDDLRKQIDDAQADARRAAANAASAQKQLEDREAAWRLARDNFTKNRTPATTWALNGASFLLENARVHLISSRLILENAEAALAARKLEHDRRGRLRTYIRDNLDLEEKSFEAQTAELNEQVKKLEATRATLTRQYKLAEDAFESAQLKFAAAQDEARAAALIERDMREDERDRYHLELDHLQGQLIVLAARKRVWTLRYDIARGTADPARIPDVIRELDAEAQGLDEELAEAQQDLLTLQSRYSAVQKQIDEGVAGDSRTALLRKNRAALQASIDNCLSYVGHLFSMSAQERSLIADLQEKYRTVSVWEKARAWWQAKGATVLNTELWQSGGYAVRLREFLIALALIVLGNWGARRAIAMLVWLLSKRFKFDETSDRSLSRLLSYIAGIAIFLGALHIVGIPLTAFAFLGGAIAIGIGFGTQNLFKNLMSGLLLMLKRPFRLGNVIEVGGVIGKVSDIGISSTVIRTFDEKEVVIPNSELLEKQLVNWSLSDQMQRRQIDVGVEYGTPPRLVRETLLSVLVPLQEDSMVLKKPEPWVCFANFGESSLDFSLYYWINQRRVAGNRVDSQVREDIVAAFEEAGIVIAFPHLDVTHYQPKPPAMPARRDDDRSTLA